MDPAYAAGPWRPATSCVSITSAAYEACWEIPADEPTAVNGHWTAGPNDDLFKALRNELGKLPFIAEDLGYITPEVRALRKKLDIPGMKVMQFGFGDRGAHIYLPHMFTPDSVVYTGTHDNNTTVGWWDNDANENEKRWATEYLGNVDDGIHWAFIRAAFASVATLAVIPVQDVLGLTGDCPHEYSQQARRQLVMASAAMVR